MVADNINQELLGVIELLALKGVWYYAKMPIYTAWIIYQLAFKNIIIYK